jgi:hypothetical protein
MALVVTRYFKQSSKSSECDVIVELAGGKEVVLNDRMIKDGRPIGGYGFLYKQKKSLK